MTSRPSFLVPPNFPPADGLHQAPPTSSLNSAERPISLVQQPAARDAFSDFSLFLIFCLLGCGVLLTGVLFFVAKRWSHHIARHAIAAALQQRDEQYRAVVEDQTEMICRFRPDGTLTFVNTSYCRYFNQPESALVGSNFLDLVPPPDRAAVTQLLHELHTLTPDHPLLTQEHPVVTANGQVGWQQWTNRAIFNPQGQLIEFQAVGQDISDRKAAETELHATYTNLEQYKNQLEVTNLELQDTIDELLSAQAELHNQNLQLLLANQIAYAEQTRYQNLFEFAPNGYAITNGTDRIQEANRALAQLLHQPQEALIGNPLLVYVVEGDRPSVSHLLNQFRQQPNATPQDLEISFYAPTMAPFPANVRVAPIYSHNQTFLGVRWAIHDITQRKQTEATLAESEARFQEIAHAVSQVFFLGAANTREYLYVSPAYEKIWGYPCETLYQNPNSWYEQVHPDDRPRVLGRVIN
ncbi:MAG: PAS domain S-box protein [Leptolyngbyaceae cyanobacterium bins.349]|nr:PAS domain S-box protein [Leptolyngbyaceae cyanobacterium bins.349]